MAILAAFNCPEVEIIGMTSIYGNVPTTMATQNALFLAELAGRPDVPVAEGCHTSLKGVVKAHLADFVHGSDGFGNTAQPQPAGSALAGCTAAEFIVRAANESPGEVTVLALAALTNIALALQLDPKLQYKLVRVLPFFSFFVFTT
jgi:uridine nucleosidase